MIRTKRSIVLGVMLLSALALAAEGTLLKRTYVKGETTRYRIKANLELGGQEIQLNAIQSEKIVDIAADGTATIEEGFVEGKISVAGQEIEIPASPANVVMVASTGHIKEIKGDDVQAATYRTQNLQSFIYPTTAISVGDKWESKVVADAKTGAVDVKTEYSVLGSEMIGKFDVFKIKSSSKEVGGDGAMNESTLWIDKLSGRLIKGEGKWTNLPFPGAPAPVSGTFVLTLEG